VWQQYEEVGGRHALENYRSHKLSNKCRRNLNLRRSAHKYRISVRNLPLSAEMVKNLKTSGDA
jgi:hypothetical protein